MRILLIGGNGFIGRFVLTTLQQQGHSLALFHRGTSVAPAGVEQILGNRDRLNASAADLKRFAPEMVIDLVISSLLTHHLADAEIVDFLDWMETHARMGWFINDLHRHPLAYHSIRWLTRWWSRSR